MAAFQVYWSSSKFSASTSIFLIVWSPCASDHVMVLRMLCFLPGFRPRNQNPGSPLYFKTIGLASYHHLGLQRVCDGLQI